MVMHNKSYVLDFSLDQYHRKERDDNKEFLSDKYRSLKSWKEDMSIMLPQGPIFPVCYGGMFGVKEKLLLNQSHQAWEKITNSLERGDNIVEGHYAERSWAGMLTDHNVVKNKAAYDLLKPEIADMVKRPTDGNTCGMAGMYYIRRSTNLTEYIDTNFKPLNFTSVSSEEW